MSPVASAARPFNMHVLFFISIALLSGSFEVLLVRFAIVAGVILW